MIRGYDFCKVKYVNPVPELNKDNHINYNYDIFLLYIY